MTTVLDALPSLELPPLWRWTTKWAYFLGLAGLVGSVLTHVVVVRPALARHADDEHRLRGTRAMHRTIAAAAALMVVAGLLQAVSAVARAGRTGFSAALSSRALWDYHTATPKPGDWLAAGWLSAAQVALVLVCAVLLVPLARRGPTPGAERLVTVALPLTWAVSLVKSIPLGPAAMTADVWVQRGLVQTHIIAGSAWAGGLVTLLVLTRSRHHVRDAVVGTWLTVWQRFGTVALVSVGAVALSGAWLTYREVGVPSQLLTTSFGIVLTAKLALVAVLLAAGALNQLVLLPRLVGLQARGATGSAWRLAVRHFGAVVALESAVVVLVILAAALLTGSAREQAGAPAAPPVGPALLGWGAAILALLVLALWGTARASELIARRPSAAAAGTVGGAP
ncbi:CopD family protein [Arsenicicoccus sp. oral taxon 190]|uniref:CopD family protein n=1 Tax=Arsenicicoccus sp. oral taxon 190 TaxID=1658671 RepID=UPI00067A0F66|nr:CopD family protein [Arsenicicoccus sp. oral taxon 190]AKT52315.1 hypothetical protein ADJ73_15400 [Arsenicicoccus sp. oral taxon 190]